MHKPRDLVPILLCTILSFGLNASAFAQTEALEEQAKQDIQALGGEIKAARLFGLLDEEEAGKLYEEILELQYGDLKGDDDDDEKREMAEDDKRRGGMTFARFLVRDGGDFTTLLRPEFLRRDIDLLSDAVGGDPGLVVVIESLLEDYEREFLARSEAFQDSLDLASAGYDFAVMEQSLSMIPDAPMTRAEIDRRVVAWDNEKGLGGRDLGMVSDWAERMINGLQSRARRLREVISNRSAEIESAGGAPSARELLAMMVALRQARIELRQVLETNLQSVVPEALAPDTRAALDRIRLEHGRIDARFGGADIDLERAVRQTELAVETETAILEKMIEANAVISDLIDARTAARVEREAMSARLLAAEVENDEARMSQRSKAVMTAADREIAAGLAVRDAILGQMNLIHTNLVEVDPETAADFLRIARRDGFPDQMRRRWCERAIEAAVLVPELDPEVIEAILELQFYVIKRLAELQARAIEERLELEPRVSRAMVDGLEDDYASAKGMGDETWREPGFERFDRLDDEIGRQLLVILGPELVTSLPPHGSLGTLPKEKEWDGRGKRESKGGGGSGAGGKARGSKRAGNASGGK